MSRDLESAEKYKDNASTTSPAGSTGSIGSTGSPRYEGYDNDRKKTEQYNEMLSVHSLTQRTFYQCLCILLAIGIALVIVVAQNPYKYTSPIAGNMLSWGGFSVYILIVFAVVTCKKDSSTMSVLNLVVAFVLGLGIGFLMALNITVQTRSIAGYTNPENI